MCIFGTIGILVRQIHMPSSVVALIRGCVGTVFLLLFVAARKTRLSWPSIRRNLVRLCASGALIGFNWILLFEAYRYTTVAVATLCYYFAPIFVTLASPLVLKEKLTPVKGISVAAALFGMVLVSGVLETGVPEKGSLTGIALGLGAAVLYAAVVLLNKRLTDISPYETTIVQLGSAALVLLPYTLLTERMGELAFTPLTVLLLIIAGVVHTGVAYALYFGSMKSLKAQTVALFSYIDPVVAILLSALLLKEPLSLFSILGAVLILGSTLLSELLDGRRGT